MTFGVRGFGVEGRPGSPEKRKEMTFDQFVSRVSEDIAEAPPAVQEELQGAVRLYGDQDSAKQFHVEVSGEHVATWNTEDLKWHLGSGSADYSHFVDAYLAYKEEKDSEKTVLH